MKLYNTLTRQKEEFTPLDPLEISLYTCGPTVYLEPHIGNWRTFIFYDLLSRVLQADGAKVKHVLNITDVGHLVSDADTGEDKIEAEAKREHMSAWDVAAKYTAKFEQGLRDLNILAPTWMPKATDHIPEQIELIRQLENKGVTYEIADGIYFDTSKYPDYGRLAGIKREQQLAGARVESASDKKHHTDFALWKFSPAHTQRDMEWDSPWGKGFPGWHLECSAMALKYLGETVDIHGGGIDHIGTHHPNEMAQSESVTGKSLARHWFHTEFLQVNGRKMSKSSGNYLFLADIAKQAEMMAFRLLVLSSHYRSEQNFTFDALAQATANLATIRSWSDRRFQIDRDHEPQLGAKLHDAKQRVQAALSNDLNTPQALADLLALIAWMDSRALGVEDIPQFEEFVFYIDQVFGLRLKERMDVSGKTKAAISQRQDLKDQGDFKAADAIRTQLLQEGIELSDTPDGPRWHRL